MYAPEDKKHLTLNPNRTGRRRIAARMLEKLRPIADMMKTSRYKFYASSVLLIYEGAEYIRLAAGALVKNLVSPLVR
jgi:hypothetical protein